MKSFSQFLREDIYYRGISAIDSKANKLVWGANEPEFADFYASRKGEGSSVIKIKYTPKNPLVFRTTNLRISASEFLVHAVKQTKKSPKAIKDKYIPMKRKLINRYGDKKYDIYDFWDVDSDFVIILELLGFDSIKVKEKGYDTIGIIRRFVK